MQGTFLFRPNRFLTRVRVDGQDVSAHLADPGRLKELLIPGRTVYLLDRGTAPVPQPTPGLTPRRLSSPARKTRYDLILVDLDGALVSVDSQLPNRLIRTALQQAFFPDLAAYQEIHPEATYDHSRFDFRLANAGAGGHADSHMGGAKAVRAVEPVCYVEVKSVSLVREGRALFPDAPTERGARHMEELIRAHREGARTEVIFVIQRSDATAFSPNDGTDPAFGQALRDAAAAGVGMRAFTCRVDPQSVCLLRQVPIILERGARE
ncbi:MAG: DNA/RNA nuclease SfsA [Firmicutes bacterium]|nr:DNA/RNA nuclease SfsA [Bacillota bacterium]